MHTSILKIICYIEDYSSAGAQACVCKHNRLWDLFPLEEMKYLIFLFPLFGSTNEAKQGVGPHAALYLIMRARNLKLKMLKISFHRVGIEPTICRVYSCTLAPVRHDKPQNFIYYKPICKL